MSDTTTSTATTTTEIKHHGQVWVLSINRPHKRNAVNQPTAKQLMSEILRFDKNPTAKVLILTGKGGCFCAGADLSAVSSGNASEMNEMVELGDTNAPMGPSRYQCSKPVIAAIEGFAVAGGLELACWCDLRICHTDAVLGVFCRRVGVPLIDGGTIRLPMLIGLSRALDLILTGRAIQGQEAYDMGLINRIVSSKEQVLPCAEQLALDLCKVPFECLKQDRLSTLENACPTIQAQLLNEFRHGSKVLLSGESQHGATQFSQHKQGRHGQVMSKL